MRKPLKVVFGLLLAAVCAEASAQQFPWPAPRGTTWDNLNKEYWEHRLKNAKDKGVCETGSSQSPIPLNSIPPKTPLPELQFNYSFDPPEPYFFFTDTGHSLAWLLDPDQYRSIPALPNNLYATRGKAEMEKRSRYLTAQNIGITRNGKFYKLVEAHVHSPAEHTMDGIRYPAEVHLVHQDADRNNKVVVAVFLAATGIRKLIYNHFSWSANYENLLQRSADDSTTGRTDLSPICRFADDATLHRRDRVDRLHNLSRGTNGDSGQFEETFHVVERTADQPGPRL